KYHDQQTMYTDLASSSLDLTGSGKTFSYYMDKYREAMDSSSEYASRMLKMQDDFKPEFIGWEMSHSFRANNRLGAPILHKFLYRFDNEMKSITGRVDLGAKDDD